MSNTRIWKWDLLLLDRQSLTMPQGAQILSVQTQDGTPRLWALVDTTAPEETRTFDTHGTGNPIESDDPGDYVGTYQIHGGALVYHVFEVKP